MKKYVAVVAALLTFSNVKAWSGFSETQKPPVSQVIAAIERGNIAEVKVLVGQSSLADWDAETQHKAIVTALRRGSVQFSPNIADYLLLHGISIDSVSRSGMSPLMDAIFLDQPEIVAYCISRGASI